MLRKWLFQLTANRPCRLINVAGKPYMERYYIGRLLGKTIYLHRFVNPDGERDVHDHPFDGHSVVLCGAYDEEVVTSLEPTRWHSETVRRAAPCYHAIPGSFFHCIVACEPETWTLFWHGDRHKGWGFLSRDFIESKAGQRPCLIYDNPFEESDPNWHLSAPKGRDAGRVCYAA